MCRLLFFERKPRCLLFTGYIATDVCLYRSWEMQDKLTFDNLHEMLAKFGATGDANWKYSAAMSNRINHGVCLNKTLLMFYFVLKVIISRFQVPFSRPC